MVVVEGRAPIWRYGMALHHLHGSPAAAIAFYDPKLGAVVVATHSREWTVGQVVEITLPQTDATQV
ncbi:CRISPR-associated ring nuclease Crn3/Csx3 [Candidatus Methanocrinis natronophilus]|uniref:CRISPR-associated ring nuclease Crn3/Csx3 n=1 Tax=Candidatus Methanocrinis natronophilus TaxID=3033396 RepID=A0ABT5X4Z7_9EURY|nr:CRISPR-associated ring nuclease Crn3/Csx3 [Candidatus Methanocrinis natronophilus]MDF0589662.1 CRISPR-associated ring nuclease Crn3/Csx3 [Candidatus Methanocrinis natronophilus]